ncbi:MAG: hypothetical protein OHK0013_11230 [Sandaracinaceae bacterium]
MTPKKPRPDPDAVSAYVDAAPEPARTRLRALCEVLREEAPEAIERIAYGLPTWHQGENLVHVGAFAHHVGFYPGPEAIVAFADELAAFRTSKGAVQIPHEVPLPLDLVRRITRWRVARVTRTARPRAASRCGAR